MYLKIINLLVYGNPDYKGLDINKFISGSQVYDLKNGICFLKTDELNIPQNVDVTVLSEADYIAGVNEIRSMEQAAAQTIENRISAVEIGLAQVLGM